MTTQHPFRSVIRVALAALLASFPCLARAQAAHPLAADDFRLGSIPQGTDSLLIRRRIGKPDSIRTQDAAPDSPVKLVTWHYRHFRLYFTALSVHGVMAVEATDATLATARGLRVGDPVTRLRALYGNPAATYGNTWDYDDPAARLHVLRFTVRGGRIAAIYAGWILD